MKLLAFLSGDRGGTRSSTVGPLSLAAVGISTIIVFFAGLGPSKSVAAVLGLGLIVAILEWPIIGLVAVVLSGTCFQIMGSEAITGLPLSLGKLFGLLAMGAWLLKVTRDRSPFTYSPQLLALLGYLGASLWSVCWFIPPSLRSRTG